MSTRFLSEPTIPAHMRDVLEDTEVDDLILIATIDRTASEIELRKTLFLLLSGSSSTFIKLFGAICKSREQLKFSLKVLPEYPKSRTLTGKSRQEKTKQFPQRARTVRLRSTALYQNAAWEDLANSCPRNHQELGHYF